MRQALSIGVLLLVAALAGGAGGFVYAHEPQRARLVVTVAPPAPRDPAAPLSGTLTRVGGGRLTLDGDGGSIELALPPGLVVEELQALPPAALAVGTRVNVGVERSDYGLAVTGVVAVEPPR